MARGVEIYKGRVRIAFKWEGKRRYETTHFRPSAKGVADAARLRQEITDKIKFGTFRYTEYFPESRHASSVDESFYALAKKYMVIAEANRKASTWQGYRKMINNYWLPIFGTDPIKSISTGQIREAIATNGLNDKSPKTFNNAMTPLRGIFELAIDYELITVNPCRRIKALEWQPPLPDPVDAQDIDAILGALKPEWKPYFQTAFGTGARPSELLALRWDDVDFRAGMIRIERAYAGHETDVTKTHKARIVEMNPLSRAGLKAQKPATYLASGLVFTVNGKQIVSEKPPRVAWDAALKKLGMAKKKPYCTRHTFASIALSNGVNPYEVARQIGNSVDMLMRHYAKWIPNKQSGITTLFDSKTDSKNVQTSLK